MTNTQLLNALPAPLVRRYLVAALWAHYQKMYGTRTKAVREITKRFGNEFTREIL